MSDLENNHEQLFILELTYYAVITDTVTPQSQEAAGQRLAEPTGIFIPGAYSGERGPVFRRKMTPLSRAVEIGSRSEATLAC